jgi:hypothetical protein
VHRFAGGLAVVSLTSLVPFLVEEGTQPAGCATIPIVLGIFAVSGVYWALTLPSANDRFPVLAHLPGAVREEPSVQQRELTALVREGRQLLNSVRPSYGGELEAHIRGVVDWAERARRALPDVPWPATRSLGHGTFGGYRDASDEEIQAFVGERLELLRRAYPDA